MKSQPPRRKPGPADAPNGAAARRRAAPVPAPEAAEAHARVLQQFRIVFNAVKTHFQQVERKAGVGGAQIWALSVIRDRPAIGVNDLAAALNIRQPTASNLVKSLSQHALIEVRREGADRRAVQLHTTAEGRKVLRRAPGPFAGVLPEALASLDAKMLSRLEADLGALIGRLGADESAGKIPLAQL
jgi:DNA-binding MarR family transcriptional regulator